MNTKHDDGSLAQQFRQSACSIMQIKFEDSKMLTI